eukprot:gene34211-45881_t
MAATIQEKHFEHLAEMFSSLEGPMNLLRKLHNHSNMSHDSGIGMNSSKLSNFSNLSLVSDVSRIDSNIDKDRSPAFWKSLLNMPIRAFLAQDKEDRWLLHNLFFGRTNGVILESGALNGIVFTTSHFFEKQLNWTAIHIEADIVNAEQLRNLRGQ